jgi:hypothetical protein
MSDIERVRRAKQKAAKSSYRKGLEEGWLDAFLFMGLIIAVVLAVTRWL